MKVNLYKIEQELKNDFYEELHELCTKSSEKQKLKSSSKYSNSSYQFFLFDGGDEFSPNWEWLSESILNEKINVFTNPKAILLVEHENHYFAFTFGNAYAIANKYCDPDYMFIFARKLDYKTIKLTSKASPHSKMNKTINSFLDNYSLVFDSGEAFTKIKGTIKLSKGFNIYKENIEIGTSVKLETCKDTIQNLIDIVSDIYTNVNKSKDKTKIPLLKAIPKKDHQLIKKLDMRLISAIKSNVVNIEISQFDIRGTEAIFNSDADYFEIRVGHKYSKIENISLNEIVRFQEEKKVEDCELLNVSFTLYKDGFKEKRELKEVIDYIDSEERCVLLQGKWYYFNDDYQEYLADSLNEIEVLYDFGFNYSKSKHEKFLQDKSKEKIKEADNDNIDLEAMKKSLRRKFYREFYYNSCISFNNKNYRNLDRNLAKTGVGKIEVADLYYSKEGQKTIFSVKMGNASSTLAYAIDQSEATLALYQNDQAEVRKKYPIEKVGLWFVLNRKTLPEKESGQPDINSLDMFILKNRLDEWKKKVRLLGYQPVVRINYIIN